MTPLQRLAAAHAATSLLVHAVPADAWARATPCDGWDVTVLVRHLLVGERIFVALVRDGAADRPALSADADALGPSELPAAYDEGAAELQAAFALPGALDRHYPLPIGELPAAQVVELRTIEELTHGWDLARAVGRPLVVDDEVVEAALLAAWRLRAQVPPGRHVFDPPRPVADDAPPLDRLAACLGREP